MQKVSPLSDTSGRFPWLSAYNASRYYKYDFILSTILSAVRSSIMAPPTNPLMFQVAKQ